MNQKLIHNIILLLIIVNIILSFFSYLAIKTDGVLCFLKSDCEGVQKSQYGEIFGIKVSLLGTIAFILLLFIYSFALRYRDLYPYFVGANLIGTIGSLWFIYVQFFELEKICSSCMVIDSFMILIFILSVYEFVKYKKDFKSIISYFR